MKERGRYCYGCRQWHEHRSDGVTSKPVPFFLNRCEQCWGFYGASLVALVGVLSFIALATVVVRWAWGHS